MIDDEYLSNITYDENDAIKIMIWYMTIGKADIPDTAIRPTLEMLINTYRNDKYDEYIDFIDHVCTFKYDTGGMIDSWDFNDKIKKDVKRKWKRN